MKQVVSKELRHAAVHKPAKGDERHKQAKEQETHLIDVSKALTHFLSEVKQTREAEIMELASHHNDMAKALSAQFKPEWNRFKENHDKPSTELSYLITWVHEKLEQTRAQYNAGMEIDHGGLGPTEWGLP